MTLDELIERLEEIRDEHGEGLLITLACGEYGEYSTKYMHSIAEVRELDSENDYKRVVIG